MIAIGGGVTTDVVGFVASCFRRGVPHVKVPTTLMGYVDASVGIKTAVNYLDGKNRMGNFEVPKAVLLDKSFFTTLSDRDIRNGVGEILKLAIIRDRRLFDLLERVGQETINTKFQEEESDRILDAAIKGMIEELQPNLYELNLERAVDFGHTFSPCLEMTALDDLLHGEAVAIDVAFSTVLASGRGILSGLEKDRILRIMDRLALPTFHQSIEPDLLWEGLKERTAHRDGLQRVPLPRRIGKCVFINDVSYDDIKKACTELHQVVEERRMAVA